MKVFEYLKLALKPYRRLKGLQLTFFLVLMMSTIPLWSQSSDPCCGLLFQSYQVPPNQRTSLVLPLDDAVWSEPVDLEFEISFWDPGKFGYVFRAMDRSGQKLDLLYTPEDFALKLVLNEEQIIASVPFDVSMLIRNRWHQVKVHLGSDLGLQTNRKYYSAPGSFELTLLDFGVNQRDEIQSSEVLPMAVRTILLKEQGIPKHHWPLNEISGNKAKDAIGNRDAQVRNPIWMRTKNSNWELRATLESDYFPALSFDSSRQSIYVFNTDQTQIFNLHSNQWLETEGHDSELMRRNANFAIYNPYGDVHHLYDAQPTNSHLYSTEKGWLLDTAISDPKPYRWKHVQLINPLDSMYYIFGGYGYFKSLNSLLVNNMGRWVEVPLRGDVYDPRYSPGLAVIAGSQYYLFGGIGNQTGAQELGFKNYYDLHILDLADSSISKVAQFEEPEEHYLPASNMVYHKQDSCIYLLANRNFDTQSQGLVLLKLDLQTLSWEAVSDSIRYDRPGLDRSDAYLWQNGRTQELLAVVRLADDEQFSSISIYSLNFPPQAPLVIKSADNWLASVVSLLVMALISWLSTLGVAGKTVLKIPGKAIDPSGPSLRVFGTFSITNKSGQDITREFSPKLQELLLVLLMAYTRPEGGLDTQTLTEWVWPDLSASKAKNSRGVNFKRLREALSHIPTVSIAFEDELWKLKFESDFKCDYLQFVKLKRHQPSSELCEQLAKIVFGGPMVPHLNSPWVERHRAETSNEIIDWLLDCCRKQQQKENYALLEKLADILLKFDDLSEEGLRFKLRSLISNGKSGVALQYYQTFSQRYEKLLGSPLAASFSEITATK